MPLGNKSSLNLPHSTRSTTRPPTRKRVNIDREIKSADYDTLDWAVRARRLGQFLVFRVETPITIGIQGDWGSGKSSFINLIETSLGTAQAALTHDQHKLAAQLRQYACTDRERPEHTANAYVLRFDSWTFAQSSYSADELFPLYVTQVIDHYLRAAGRIEEDSTALRRLLHVGSRVGKLALAAAANMAGDATSEAVLQALSTPAQVVDVLASFKSDFQRLVDTLLTRDDDRYTDRLIIIVDDLDRITPRSAVELTEKIKVLLDVQGVVFILAADLTIIQDGLRDKFGSDAAASDGKNYLDKIVKIQYNVPQMETRDLVELALGYGIFCEVFGIDPANDEQSLLTHNATRLLRVFPGIGGNIRNSKRVLNNFEFSAYLLRTDEHSRYDQRIGIPLLALTILYQYDYDVARRFYRWLLRQEASATLVRSAEPDDRHDLVRVLVPDADEEEQGVIDNVLDLLASHDYTIADWLAAFTATSMGPAEASTGAAS